MKVNHPKSNWSLLQLRFTRWSVKQACEIFNSLREQFANLVSSVVPWLSLEGLTTVQLENNYRPGPGKNQEKFLWSGKNNTPTFCVGIAETT